MPALLNSRRELFAQAVADGKTVSDAYAMAGFKPHRANAAKLRHNTEISERVGELLAERETIHAQAVAKAIEATGITKEQVIRDLIEVKDRALQKVEVLDREGKPTGEFKFEGGVACRALELLGKELGMFIETRRHGVMAGTGDVTFVMRLATDV